MHNGGAPILRGTVSHEDDHDHLQEAVETIDEARVSPVPDTVHDDRQELSVNDTDTFRHIQTHSCLTLMTSALSVSQD